MIKEMLADAWPIIEKVAPALAQAIGGPVLGSAVTAFGWLAKKFEANELSALVDRIVNDPDSESKLQQIDLDFSDEMTKAAVRSVGKLASLKANVEIAWRE